MQIDDPNFSIRINQAGVRKLLDEFESDIMEVFWASSEPRMTVKDVHHGLCEKRDVLHGTIVSTMSRLVDKGYLSMVDTVGMANYYAANCTKEQLINSTIDHIMQTLFKDFPMQTARALAAYARADLNAKIAKVQTSSVSNQN